MLTNSIRRVVREWAHKNGYVLGDEGAEPRRTFFHVSSNRGETFQIIVVRDSEELVRVDGHLIESPSDEKAHFTWRVPSGQIVNILNVGVESARAWFKRD